MHRTRSGSSSFSSTITRFIRFGTKNGEPTCRSEMWAIVATTSPVYAPGPRKLWHDGGVGVLDLLIIAWAVLAAIGGYRRGASIQVAEYAGLAAGLIAGAVVAPTVASLASSPGRARGPRAGGALRRGGARHEPRMDARPPHPAHRAPRRARPLRLGRRRARVRGRRAAGRLVPRLQPGERAGAGRLARHPVVGDRARPGGDAPATPAAALGGQGAARPIRVPPGLRRPSAAPVQSRPRARRTGRPRDRRDRRARRPSASRATPATA